jgi:hypothetical protein
LCNKPSSLAATAESNKQVFPRRVTSWKEKKKKKERKKERKKKEAKMKPKETVNY